MSELRVPTLATAAEVVCADGRKFTGRIFVPGTALRHAGPMRAKEWINDPARFFPFQPDDGSQAFLLNKREVVVLTVPAAADQGDIVDEAGTPMKRVAIEAEALRLEGTVAIEMPENERRVLDYLNRPSLFLTLRDGDSHHLVQKERITRVIEIREE